MLRYSGNIGPVYLVRGEEGEWRVRSFGRMEGESIGTERDRGVWFG
jgi:hypothetical protein